MKPARPAKIALAAVALCAACGPAQPVAQAKTAPPAARSPVARRAPPSEGPRLLPAEVYLRTYLMLFGGLTPAEVQARARDKDGGALFDTWEDYLSALGFPDYRLDLPRGTQTNSLMMAAFERLGVALCDRAVERDLKAQPPAPVAERHIFAFDLPARDLDAAEFAPRFDVLHRTFLSYPASLAPKSRAASFFALYQQTVARHRAGGAPKSRFTPAEAGWAVVCYGLVRHPEFHLF